MLLTLNQKNYCKATSIHLLHLNSQEMASESATLKDRAADRQTEIWTTKQYLSETPSAEQGVDRTKRFPVRGFSRTTAWGKNFIVYPNFSLE